MIRTIVPILAFLLAGVVFFAYIRPTFEGIKVVQDEVKEYDVSIQRAAQLRQRVSDLTAQMDALSTTDLERLEAILPDDIDQVELLISLDAVVRARGMTFDGVGLSGNRLATNVHDRFLAPADQKKKSSTSFDVFSVSFSTTGTYENFKRLIRDLEKSLVLMEVKSIAFSSNAKSENPGQFVSDEIYTFSVTLETHSLSSI